MFATFMMVLAGTGSGVGAAAVDADRLFAGHLALTTVAVHCPGRSDPGEVTVCGRRRADRFRLPLQVPPDPDDPRDEGVPAERERLLARTDNCAEKSAFLIGCGKVGVGVTTGGGRTRLLTARELSP